MGACFLQYLQGIESRRIVGSICGLAIGVAVIAFLMVGFTPSASGYVLQGPHVLDLMAKVMSEAKTLEVSQVVTIDDPSLADHPLVVPETLTYAFPDRFRSDAQFEGSHRIFVSVRGERLSIIDGQWRSDPPSRYDRYKDLLLLNSRSRLQQALFSDGVDVGITSLGRFEDRIVYVIGAHYPDETVSQVWVDKELFLPLRWLDVDPRNPVSKLEFVYRRWHKNGDLWYPSQIEILENSRITRTILANKVEVDPALPANLWDLSYIKTSFPPVGPPPDAGAADKAVDEVQQAIESFQKKFEP